MKRLAKEKLEEEGPSYLQGIGHFKLPKKIEKKLRKRTTSEEEIKS